jgi:hypothetical protein
MPFHVTYDSEIDCVVTTVAGDMDKNLVADFFAEVGKIAVANNCSRILSDLRDAKIVAPTTDIYEMAKSIEEKGILTSLKRAIVISKDHEDYTFWETVCYNQGHRRVKIFQNYEQARDWVLMQ